MDLFERNALIAEFMKWETGEVKENSKEFRNWFFSPDNYFPECISGEYYFTNEWTLSTLCFHNSWDWLIPVVKKYYEIWNLQNSNSKLPRIHYTISSEIDDALGTCDLDRLFNAIAAFIIWYNKTK
jgi:hypothetical protein